MLTRNQSRLKYDVFHNTGRKVYKQDEEKVSMTTNNELEERKIRENVSHTKQVYPIDELDSESEVREFIRSMDELGQRFRHVHLELRDELGVDIYSAKYADFVDFSEKIYEDLRRARKQLKIVSNTSREMEAMRKTQMINAEKVEECSIKMELVDEKVSELEDSFDLKDGGSVIAIKEFNEQMEQHLREYLQLSKSLKYYLGFKYKEYEDKIDERTKDMRGSLKLGKALLEKVSNIGRQADSERESKVLISKLEHLDKEIQFRCEFVEVEYDRDLEALSDYQILEVSRNQNLDRNFNEILEKVTLISSLALGHTDGQDIVDKVFTTRDMIVEKRKTFQKTLDSIMKDRDISPEKLKNSGEMKIEIPKFSGYDSPMNFFTFKAEFRKLIEPTIQKAFWADYLKRNYLSGKAFTLVEKEKDYEKIWDLLQTSYGNTRLLLQNKLGELDKCGNIANLRGEENIVNALSKLVNAMKDLTDLAIEHGLEGQLYEGGGLEKVFSLIGTTRHRKFRSDNEVMTKEQEWIALRTLLEKEVKMHEKILVDKKSCKLMGMDMTPKCDKGNADKTLNKSAHFGKSELKCHICDSAGHTVIITARKNKIIPYYVCEIFVKMSPKERFEKLKAKNFCTKCLYPGAIDNNKHKCMYLQFCCTHDSHGTNKIHVLLCESHRNESSNLDLFSKFKNRFIEKCPTELPQFSKNLSCFSQCIGISVSSSKIENKFQEFKCEEEVTDSAIFELQTIKVESIKLNLFYDSGCGDMVVRKSVVEKLAAVGRAIQIVPGPIILSGVGDQKSVCIDGVYSICLPLYNNGNAILTGLCLPKITTTFPTYDLSKVEKDIKQICSVSYPEIASQLPKLSRFVGSDTDILLGSKFKKYFPKSIVKFESGLEISESFFVSSDGSRGVVSGPHSEFSKAEKNFSGLHAKNLEFECKSVYHLSVSDIIESLKAQEEVPLLGLKTGVETFDVDESVFSFSSGGKEVLLDTFSNDVSSTSSSGTSSGTVHVEPICPKCLHAAKKAPRSVKLFDEIERAGTEVSFRCVDCRECKKCKSGERLDNVSLQEEVEQELIERSVHVDIERCITIALLPFLVNPDSRLVPNENEALKVYKQMCRKLSKTPNEKKGVIEFEHKLQNLSFVDFFSNLSEEEQALILDYAIRNFIPWIVVFNEGSVTSGTRMVFHASQAPKGGCSLNSLLAKGVNGMNKIVEILIRWTVRVHACATDITKMYNNIRLDKSHWRYQLYLWNDSLDENEQPHWKVIKTFIYGVRSSGNIAECGLRRTAELSRDKYPKAFNTIMHDCYVDDLITGSESEEETLKLTDELQATLAKGGFTLKGFAMTGEEPPDTLSFDNDSVLVAGLKWFPKGDFISLNVKELNFNKKVRGKKSHDNEGVIPLNLTKRDCVSKASEIFDPTGKITPITAGFKLDISVLHQRSIDWDDPIPNELKEIWMANFELMKEIKDLKFERAVIPKDAVSLNCETIETADAGESIICAAIYVRFKRRNGENSCQLIFSRSKVIHDHTIPRAELAAALLNATTGHTVKLSLGDMITKSWKISDSQVALHWLNCTKAALKLWVRTRVIEIIRLTDRSTWFHTASKNMIADLATRKGAKVEDVGPDSSWICGLPWMRDDESNFPIVSIGNMNLSLSDECEVSKEKVQIDIPNQVMVTKYVPEKVGERYQFSKYLVDPNRYRFRTVVRILGLVFLYLHKISRKVKKLDILEKVNFYENGSHERSGSYVVTAVKTSSGSNLVAVVHLTERMLEAAKNYYFLKATLEIEKFVSPKKYKNISVYRDNILFYKNRLLPSQNVDGKLELCDVCLDLSVDLFFVPLIDALSPVAYAIAMETHWYDPDVAHRGVESLLRVTQNTAHIIDGRHLIKTIKSSCARCRYLEKRKLSIAMGPVGENNLRICPPFYSTQVDLCGPFDAYGSGNKRAVLKVYFVVYCCTVTSTVDIRVMENYTTDEFVMSFVRFSCRFGFPKMLLPDEASQLIKACNEMTISYSDVQNKLSTEYGVEFKTCPPGGHNVHGKVERKIQEIKRSINKVFFKVKLSVIRWETLGQQIANSINNLPIGLGNKSEMLENADILTPNRLILGRNNNRCPTAPLELQNDLRRIVQSNNEIFESWFKAWLISYVPKLVEQPKWFDTERNICVGDVVLFLKSDKEFQRLYQYGMVVTVFESRDGVVRKVEVEYQNAKEKTKRRAIRAARELVVIHPIDEIWVWDDLAKLAGSANCSKLR